MLDIDDAPSQEEMAAVRQHAGMRVRRCRKKSLYAVIGLLLSIGLDVPFSAGMPLHRYWDKVSGVLFFVTMAAFLTAVYCFALWWGAWSQLRDLEKTYSS